MRIFTIDEQYLSSDVQRVHTHLIYKVSSDLIH